MRSTRITPVYRLEWDDGTVRQTDDEDAFDEPLEEVHPESIEALAMFAREDPECTCTLLGMAN